ncbi:MAG TPA: MarR family transcriptional regulator [Candidatus Baltobacteraceae bacterium]|nr:MarR family transcriptional regulator [Candidatus Baltobacteraceae bacterium]
MARYPGREERAERSLRAYTTFLDTADWLKAGVRVPLGSYGLTIGEFRLLHVLYREGALPMVDLARRRGSNWHNMATLIEGMESRGWVGRRIVTLPPVEFERAHLPRSRRDERRRGRRLTVVGMTADGKEFMRGVLSIHSKLVRALMRALDLREQDALFRLCRKLRAGEPGEVLRGAHA